MEVIINGNSYSPSNSSNLEELVKEYNKSDCKKLDGIAVAVNQEVIPKQNWKEYEIKAGDKIELISAVQGG
ncbi:MAG: sulfur carrier protein ThiS [Flavobacteriales bacterium]